MTHGKCNIRYVDRCFVWFCVFSLYPRGIHRNDCHKCKITMGDDRKDGRARWSSKTGTRNPTITIDHGQYRDRLIFTKFLTEGQWFGSYSRRCVSPCVIMCYVEVSAFLPPFSLPRCPYSTASGEKVLWKPVPEHYVRVHSKKGNGGGAPAEGGATRWMKSSSWSSRAETRLFPTF